MLQILKDEIIISQKYGPVRLQAGTEVNPDELGLDEVTVNSLIGRGVAKDTLPATKLPVITEPAPENLIIPPPVKVTPVKKTANKPTRKK